jgi:alpha-glucosidase (family GH31 glycosyl hydrolase)
MKNGLLLSLTEFLLSLVLTVAGDSMATEPAPSSDTRQIWIPKSAEVWWWAGIIDHGFQMPLSDGYEVDLRGDTYGNQGQPLLLSSQGDVIWSEDALRIKASGQGLLVQADDVQLRRGKSRGSLRDAFLYARKHHLHGSAGMPDELLFLRPQYNTWIELMYDQNQADIMKYARGIQVNGFAPGVLMVDDNWQQNYGQWDFKPNRFPDPKAMVAGLHADGFKVMLWICPFVHTNSEPYAKLAERGLLLKDTSGSVALIKWWNGESALLDFTNPEAVDWFNSRLDYLQSTYAVDGFKFDAGDSSFYKGVVAAQSVSPNTHSELYGKIGLRYPLNEYRAMWKMGCEPLAERLRDKDHSWTDLRKLIPNMLLAGLMGYPFSCPDMIGGGEYKSFQAGATIDQELVVRSAQCHALMPMMQFSVAPWRVLDEAHLKAVLKAVKVRQVHQDYILDLARKSALTGEPIVRSMEYVFPHQGYAQVKDQFLLGDRFLVAPVLQRGSRHREVALPKGKWRGFDGNRYVGPAKVTPAVALDDLCYFEKVK